MTPAQTAALFLALTALVGWINGWSTMARVYDELAVSVRLLLPGPVARV